MRRDENGSLIERLRERAADPTRATDQGAGFPQPVPAPLDEDDVAVAETKLGFPLPPLLRAIYLEVANGGVGPGYGLLPLDAEAESVVALYSAFTHGDPEQPWTWPNMLLPFCDWGCAIRSCVDCSQPGAPVLTFDPNVLGESHDVSNAIARTHTKLSDWLSDWLAGVKLWDVMFEVDHERTREMLNPFTKEPIRLIATKLRRP